MRYHEYMSEHEPIHAPPRQLPSTSAGSSLAAFAQAEIDRNRPYEQDARSMREAQVAVLDSKATKTQQSYVPCRKEFIEWANARYPFEGSPATVNEAKLLAFLRSMAERKRRVKAPDGKHTESTTKTVGYATYERYVSAIIDLYQRQKSERVNDHPNPRGSSVKAFMQQARTERERQKRANFDNKDHIASHGYSPEFFVRLCRYFLTSPPATGLRGLAAQTLAHHCVLRGASLRLMELSDLFVGRMGAIGDSDTGLYLCLAMNQSKTNRTGRTEYTGLLRHRNPMLCGIFALALYLFYCLHQLEEKFPDLSSNSTWYRVKLLRDATDQFREITYATHNQPVAKAFKALGLSGCSKTTHAARGSGAREAEARGVCEEDIERLGLWKDQHSALRESYLTSLPFAAMRAMAGFRPDGHEYFLPRATVEPPDELAKQIFPDADFWLETFEKAQFKDHAEQAGNDEDSLPAATSDGATAAVPLPKYHRSSTGGRGDGGATAFCKLMIWLRTVLLQDIHVLAENDIHHPILEHAIFKSQLFRSWIQHQKEKIAATITPLNSSLKVIAPSIYEHMIASEAANRSDFVKMTDLTREIQIKVDALEELGREGAIMNQNNLTVLGDIQGRLVRSSRREVAQHQLQARHAEFIHQESQRHLSDIAALRREATPPPPPLQPVSSGSSAATPAMGDGQSDPNALYDIDPNASTVRDIWTEWTTGYAGKRPLRDVEEEHGIAWCGGSKTSKRKRFKRRFVVVRQIEEMETPEKQEQMIAHLQAYVQGKSLDWLRKRIEEKSVPALEPP